MSTEEDKFKNSKRRLKDENAIKKQMKIAKEHKVTEFNPKLEQPHRYHKHHVMNCGNPDCFMCANPRKTWNELTIQEKREFQELETIRMRHSNGTLTKDADE
jgi:hypothetical protein